MAGRSLPLRLRTANVLLHPRRLFYGPDWIILGVNNACNLHCRMCDVGMAFEGSNFHQNLMGSEPLNMPLELVARVVDQTASHWPRAGIGFAFTEPLAYPHIVDAVGLASARGLRAALTTNGLTLARHAEGLVKAGLRHLSISLDGPPAIHNEIRGNKASFQRAIEGLQLYLASAAATGVEVDVGIFCTITQWKIGHLIEFLEILRPLPLAQVGLMHTSFVTEDAAASHNGAHADYPATPSNLSGIDLEAMDLDLLFDELTRIESRTWPWPLSFSPRIPSREALDTYYRKPETPVGRRCNDVFSKLLIQSNGDVLPGAGRCFHVPMGNINKTPLVEIWNAPPLAAFRRTLVGAGGLLPACSRCCAAYG